MSSYACIVLYLIEYDCVYYNILSNSKLRFNGAKRFGHLCWSSSVLISVFIELEMLVKCTVHRLVIQKTVNTEIMYYVQQKIKSA